MKTWPGDAVKGRKEFFATAGCGLLERYSTPYPSYLDVPSALFGRVGLGLGRNDARSSTPPAVRPSGARSPPGSDTGNVERYFDFRAAAAVLFDWDDLGNAGLEGAVGPAGQTAGGLDLPSRPVQRWAHLEAAEKCAYVHHILGQKTLAWTRTDSMLFEESMKESAAIASRALRLQGAAMTELEERTLHRAEFERLEQRKLHTSTLLHRTT